MKKYESVPEGMACAHGVIQGSAALAAMQIVAAISGGAEPLSRGSVGIVHRIVEAPRPRLRLRESVLSAAQVFAKEGDARAGAAMAVSGR